MFCFVPGLAGAAGELPEAAAPDARDSLSGDLGVYNDYIARGLSYSSEKVSFQAHLEYDWARGPYLGAALNHYTVTAGTESPEFNVYAGYLGHFDDFTIDAGVFCWLYPRHRLPRTDARYNTVEGYAGAGYKAFSVRFWYDLTDYWALDGDTAPANYGLPPNGSSQGSLYVDANWSQPLPYGVTLVTHAGHQWIRRYGQLDYSDFLIGVQKDLGHGFVAGISRTDTTADPVHYTDFRGIDLARAKWLMFLKWTFP